MSCCMFGVCIPYSAIIPLCLIGVQWVASKLASVGLLPEFLAKKLGLPNGNSDGAQSIKSVEEVVKEAGGSCCGSGGGSEIDSTKRCNSLATTDTNCSSEEESGDDNNSPTTAAATTEKIITHIDTKQQFQTLHQTHTKSPTSILIIKFTAEWCKPCHAIQPTYLSLADQYSSTKKRIKFITVDVDGEDCDVISSQYRVAMMPTFVCLRGGKEVGRMSGGGGEERLKSWVGEMIGA